MPWLLESVGFMIDLEHVPLILPPRLAGVKRFFQRFHIGHHELRREDRIDCIARSPQEAHAAR